MINNSLLRRIALFFWAAGIPFLGLGIYAIGNDLSKDNVGFLEFYPNFVKKNSYRLLYLSYTGNLPKGEASE